MSQTSNYDELWQRILTDRIVTMHAERWLFGVLPAEPRCTWCHVPFGGRGGAIFRRFLDRHPSNYNPRVCNTCDRFLHNHPGGAEVELSLMFVDVRGSTHIAQQMSATDFKALMERFYTVATDAIAENDGLIEKFVGDEVAAIFVPGFSGQDHAAKALAAARQVLRSSGYAPGETPWLPVGAAIHSGIAYVGVVGTTVTHLTVLGDVPNTTARLASLAGAGQILVSDAACKASGLEHHALEHRDVELKGRQESIGVCVIG
jgi:adenylate cyclase